MSRSSWAAIVYGRSYHLDFRLIAIPQDFTTQEIAWALPYILATTQRARNLANYPRWSLFKNDTHCVVGVTCMVRDLLGNLEENLVEVMTKDKRGRPLYVFVGYVTQLNKSDRSLSDLPDYGGQQLDIFQPLYQQIERVWLAKEYEDRQPWLSQYQVLDGTINLTFPSNNDDCYLAESNLNSQSQYPHQTFLWSRSREQNRYLWLASAQCREATSICLDIQGKHLPNSPFLNQTATKIEQFTIRQRMSEISSSNNSKKATKPPIASLKQKISHRAKTDLDLTLQQAAKVTAASQEIVTNLNPWVESEPASDDVSSRANPATTQLRPNRMTSQNDVALSNSPTSDELDNFGFKAKKPAARSQKPDKTLNDSTFTASEPHQQDWF